MWLRTKTIKNHLYAGRNLMVALNLFVIIIHTQKLIVINILVRLQLALYNMNCLLIYQLKYYFLHIIIYKCNILINVIVYKWLIHTITNYSTFYRYVFV